MLSIIFYYLLTGFIISIFINGTLWALYKPMLSFSEVFACTVLWPTVISTFINTMNGVEEDIEE